MNTLIADLRYAFRALARNPAYSLATVVTLCLGIGANALVFTLASAVFVRPLPFAQASELVKVTATRRLASGALANFAVSGRDFVAFSKRNTTLSGVGAILAQSFSVTTTDAPQMVRGGRVSASMWSVLGVHAVAGRTFTDAEDTPSGGVAVISEGLQRRLFVGPPSAAVGKTFNVDGQPRVVVGVMPFGFAPLLTPGDVWVPLGINEATIPPGANRAISLVGRLRRGTTADQARTDISRVAADLAVEEPDTHKNYGGNVIPLREDIADSAQSLTLTLLAAVGFLLLLACANSVNLALARVARRGTEISTRLALGASRGSILRLQLCESVLLGFMGGVLGITVAAGVLRPLLRLATSTSPLLGLVTVDWRVVTMVLVVSILTGVACGVGPGLYGIRAAGGRALAGGGQRQQPGVHDRRLRRLLMSMQVATAAVLLIGAIGMVATLRRLAKTEVGFKSNGVVVAGLTLPSVRYPGTPQRAAFAAGIIDKLTAIPGIEGVALTSNVFIRGDVTQTMLSLQGRDEGADSRVPADLRRIDGRYFETLGIPILSGRAFVAADRDSAPPVAIVSRSFARQYFGASDVLGKRIRSGAVTNPWLTIVGVAQDVMDRGVGIEIGPMLYVPYRQRSSEEFAIVLRTSLSTAAVERAIRDALHSIDPERALDNIVPLSTLLSNSVGQERFQATIIGALAALALILAGTGIFGVTSFLVAERAREIAIRLALGADVSRVVRDVVLDGARWTAGACAVGLIVAQAMTSIARKYLPALNTTAGVTYVGTGCLLLALGVIASGIPAWRVTRISPANVLRGS